MSTIKSPLPSSNAEKEDAVDFTDFPAVPPLLLESSSLDVVGMESGTLPLPPLPSSLEDIGETSGVEAINTVGNGQQGDVLTVEASTAATEEAPATRGVVAAMVETSRRNGNSRRLREAR